MSPNRERGRCYADERESGECNGGNNEFPTRLLSCASSQACCGGAVSCRVETRVWEYPLHAIHLDKSHPPDTPGVLHHSACWMLDIWIERLCR